MSTEFGNRLRKQLWEIDQTIVDQLRNDRSAWTSEVFLQTFGQFVACDEEEIEQLREFQTVAFIPAIYRQYLQVMGRKNGKSIFKGSRSTFNDLKVLKQNAIQIVQDGNSGLELPTDAFVFLMYQGTEFYYFPTDQKDDDPPVYYYSEQQSKFTKVADNLSAWFEEFIDKMKREIGL